MQPAAASCLVEEPPWSKIGRLCWRQWPLTPHWTSLRRHSCRCAESRHWLSLGAASQPTSWRCSACVFSPRARSRRAAPIRPSPPPRGTRDKTRKPPDSLPHGGVISGVWESLPLLRLVILANKRMTDTEFCHHESFDAGPSARSWRWLRFRRAPHSIELVRGFRPRQSPEIPHRLITTACGMHGIRDLAQRACRQ